MARSKTIIITPRGRLWVSEIVHVRAPWERWAIRLRWALRNAPRIIVPAVLSMVEMQKRIG